MSSRQNVSSLTNRGLQRQKKQPGQKGEEKVRLLQRMRCADAPWWLLCALTVAAESLLPEAEQHVQTHTAISRLIKVLHPPDVLPIFLYHL